MKRPTQIQYLLHRSPHLNKILQSKAHYYARLLHLRQLLPENIYNQCVSVNFQHRVLIIHVTSPLWASRLRLLQSKLIQAFAVKQVRVRVATPLHSKTEQTRMDQSGPRHSMKGAKLLLKLAQDQEDTEIANRLKRLATAVKPKG